MEEVQLTCEREWQDVLDQCRRKLSEKDFQDVLAFSGPDTLSSAIPRFEKEYPTEGRPRLLHRIQRHVDHLVKFSSFVTSSIQISKAQAACLWGSIGVLIKLACEFDSVSALEEIEAILRKLDNKLQLFDRCNGDAKLEPSSIRDFTDVLVDLVLGSVSVISSFSESSYFTWTNLHQEFAKVLGDISARVDHFKELTKADSLRQTNEAHRLGAREQSSASTVSSERHALLEDSTTDAPLEDLTGKIIRDRFRIYKFDHSENHFDLYSATALESNRLFEVRVYTFSEISQKLRQGRRNNMKRVKKRSEYETTIEQDYKKFVISRKEAGNGIRGAEAYRGPVVGNRIEGEEQENEREDSLHPVDYDEDILETNKLGIGRRRSV